MQKIEAVSLKSWIENQYKSYPNISPRQQKEEVAHELKVGVATIYRWLKDGNIYIEDLGSDDTGGALSIWKMEKTIIV